MSIASKLKEYRSRSGLTQRELAERVGRRQQHIDQLERGLKQPNVRTVARLAKALRLSVQEIGELVKEAEIE